MSNKKTMMAEIRNLLKAIEGWRDETEELSEKIDELEGPNFCTICRKPFERNDKAVEVNNGWAHADHLGPDPRYQNNNSSHGQYLGHPPPIQNLRQPQGDAQ